MVHYVPPSAPKSRLMANLNLTQGNQTHENIYLIIKAECTTGYDAICADRRNLRTEHAHVLDRFAYNQMKDTAIDNAIIQIYQNSQPSMQAQYARWGVDGTPNNFVIRWFLYHLFRNRDLRNDRRARGAGFHDDDDDEGGSGGGLGGNSQGSRNSKMIGAPAKAPTSMSTAMPMTSKYYDPARNRYQNVSIGRR